MDFMSLVVIAVILLGMDQFMVRRHKLLTDKLDRVIEALENISSYVAPVESEKIRSTKVRLKDEFKEYADDITDEYAAAVMAMNAWIFRHHFQASMRGEDVDRKKAFVGSTTDLMVSVIKGKGVALAPPKLKAFLETLDDTELRQAFARTGW